MDQLNSANLEDLPPEVADMLPDEVMQMLMLQKEKKLQQIESIGEAISKKRDEAVSGRAASGIEQEWAEDEDAYQGVDGANKGDLKTYKGGDLSATPIGIKQGGTTRSTVFLNITRPYVDAAAARIADMLMPTDDRNWAFKPTPIPELDQAMKQMQQPQMQQPGGPAPMQDPRLAQLRQIQDEANKRSESAQTQIDDWQVECGWHGEIRKVIENCSRLGTGVLKGPVPAKRKRRKTSNGQMVMEIEIAPESKSIDPDRLYPDPACGESIHNGSYVFELDELSTRQLRDLKGLPGYLSENIDKVIEEGPGKKNVGTAKTKSNEDEKFETWYYYGFLDRDDLEALDVEIEEESKLEGIPAIVTLVNDTPIRAALNPLDSGDFPYDVMPWQRRAGHWAGVGVARQIRTPQRMINAGTRNLMDNAGLSAGPQIVLWKNKIVPADGVWELSPRKLWFAREEADIKGVGDAFASFNIQSLQAELMNIIQFALKMAEDVTGLPALLQGQQGKAPETVGGMQMLQNNASSVLRRIAKSFDDHITVPHITRYYDWLMTYGEDDSMKGDFIIDARGSSALVERDMQNQAILQMGQMVMNPAFGIDPEKWFEEACKSQRLDPKRFKMDDEKRAQMAQQPPPEAPQIAAAKIRAQADAQKTQAVIQADMQKTQMELQMEQQIAQMENQTQQIRIKTDTDRDTAYVQAEVRRDQVEYQARMQELQVKRELEMLKYANANKVTLDNIKADLAKESMRLNVQKELAGVSHAMDLHKHKNPAPQVATPAVEPPGRAAPGQAFQA